MTYDDGNNDQVDVETGDEMHVVNLVEPHSLKLLSEAYREIYMAAIPEDARESLDDWMDTLEGNNDVADMSVVILGRNLNSYTPTVTGLCVGYYYKAYDSGQAAYTLVSDACAGQKLEKPLLEVMASELEAISESRGGKMSGIFLTVDDPSKMEGTAAAEAIARMQSFFDVGAKIVNIDFIEPPLADGAEKNEAVKIMAFPGKDGYPSKSQLKSFVEGIYAGLAEFSGCDPEDNPDFLKIMVAIDSTNPILTNMKAVVRVDQKKVPDKGFGM